MVNVTSNAAERTHDALARSGVAHAEAIVSP
jgi:hypothetical protein